MYVGLMQGSGLGSRIGGGMWGEGFWVLGFPYVSLRAVGLLAIGARLLSRNATRIKPQLLKPLKPLQAQPET